MAKRGGNSRARTSKQRRGGGEPQRASSVKAEDAKTSAIGVGWAPTKGSSEVVSVGVDRLEARSFWETAAKKSPRKN